MNQQLEDFYNHLNRSVVTTNDFAEGTKFRKRGKVDQFAYCGLNPVYRAYLSFDLDSPASAFRFEDVNLPAPTIITVNRTNGHSHMLYRLNTPVAYHRNSRSAPQDYFEAIQSAMESRLSADTAFNHTLTKNPLHPAWEVITFPTSYDLTDFAEWIELPKRRIAHSLPGKAATTNCFIRFVCGHTVQCVSMAIWMSGIDPHSPKPKKSICILTDHCHSQRSRPPLDLWPNGTGKTGTRWIAVAMY
jgi:hypothetical protein